MSFLKEHVSESDTEDGVYEHPYQGSGQAPDDLFQE